MTIAVALAVPDGIALAADTQTTWYNQITTAMQKGTNQAIELAQPILMPIGWSRMARKLFPLQMGATPFAVAVSGAALLNNKTPYSIFKSLEKVYKDDPAYDAVLAYLVDGLKAELKKQLGVAELSAAPQVVDVNFILAGYEDEDVSRPILRATTVYSGKPANIEGEGGEYPGHLTSWQNSASNRFNCCWTGRGEFIDHLVNHRNQALPAMAGNFPGMTLADALDYVRFLAEFTCDFQRFATVVPDCGRPVLTATLTPEGFRDWAGGAGQAARADAAGWATGAGPLGDCHSASAAP